MFPSPEELYYQQWCSASCLSLQCDYSSGSRRCSVRVRVSFYLVHPASCNAIPTETRAACSTTSFERLRSFRAVFRIAHTRPKGRTAWQAVEQVREHRMLGKVNQPTLTLTHTQAKRRSMEFWLHIYYYVKTLVSFCWFLACTYNTPCLSPFPHTVRFLCSSKHQCPTSTYISVRNAWTIDLLLSSFIALFCIAVNVTRGSVVLPFKCLTAQFVMASQAVWRTK